MHCQFCNDLLWGIKTGFCCRCTLPLFYLTMALEALDVDVMEGLLLRPCFMGVDCRLIVHDKCASKLSVQVCATQRLMEIEVRQGGCHYAQPALFCSVSTDFLSPLVSMWLMSMVCHPDADSTFVVRATKQEEVLLRRVPPPS